MTSIGGGPATGVIPPTGPPFTSLTQPNILEGVGTGWVHLESVHFRQVRVRKWLVVEERHRSILSNLNLNLVVKHLTSALAKHMLCLLGPLVNTGAVVIGEQR